MMELICAGIIGAVIGMIIGEIISYHIRTFFGKN